MADDDQYLRDARELGVDPGELLSVIKMYQMWQYSRADAYAMALRVLRAKTPERRALRLIADWFVSWLHPVWFVRLVLVIVALVCAATAETWLGSFVWLAVFQVVVLVHALGTRPRR
jgi:hypothetical protein